MNSFFFLFINKIYRFDYKHVLSLSLSLKRNPTVFTVSRVYGKLNNGRCILYDERSDSRFKMSWQISLPPLSFGKLVAIYTYESVKVVEHHQFIRQFVFEIFKKEFNNREGKNFSPFANFDTQHTHRHLKRQKFNSFNRVPQKFSIHYTI